MMRNNKEKGKHTTEDNAGNIATRIAEQNI